MKEVKRYRMVKEVGHPLSTKRGLLLLHRKVLYDKIGPGPHHCYWCGVVIEWITGRMAIAGIVVDHVDHDKASNDPVNLVPSCNYCNGRRVVGEIWTPWRPGAPVRKGPVRNGRCRRGHELTRSNVYVRPDSHRQQCRICMRARGLKWRAARRRARDNSAGASHTASVAEKAGIPTVRFPYPIGATHG